MFYEVILDSGETPNKCTIAPLFRRPDFHLLRVKGAGALGPLRSPVLLHHEGECLSQVRKSLGDIQGIASVDCVWRRLDVLIGRIAGGLPAFARIPEGFVTAYPRHSAKNTDPIAGLATIEAIFVASAMLGNWDTTLFSEYYFGRRFLELNLKLFVDLGVHQAANPDALPELPQRPRNSMQRRRDRGRPPAKGLG